MGLSGILGDVGGGFLKAGKAVGTVGDHVTPNFVGVDDAGKAIWHKGLEPALDGFEFVYRNGVSRPITTSTLLFSKLGTDDPLTPGEAWAASRNISPGQASANLLYSQGKALANLLRIDDPAEPLSRIPVIGDDLETSFEEMTGSGGRPEFDILDEQQRKQVFSHDFAKFLSGSQDTALRWFLDPTVLTGKLAAAARRETLVKPLVLTGDDAAIGAKVDAALGVRVVGKKADEAAGVPFVVDDLVHEPGGRFSMSGHMGAVANRYVNMPENRVRDELLKDKRLTGGDPATADILARASGSTEQFVTTLRTLLNPSDTNISNLDRRFNESFKDLADYSTRAKPGIDRAFDEADEVLVGAKAAGKPKKIEKAQKRWDEAYANKEAYLAEEVRLRDRSELADLFAQSAKTLPAAMAKQTPRVTLPQKIGDAVAKKRDVPVAGFADDAIGPGQYIYQPSRFSAVRVMKAAATKRIGVVRLDDPASVVENAKLLLDSAGRGVAARLPATLDPLRYARLSPAEPMGLSREVYDELLTGVTRAATLGSPNERVDALEAIEAAVLHHNAELLGIKPEVADGLFARTKVERTAAIQTLKDSAPAFSGAKRPGTNEYVDMFFKGDDGVYTRVPVANSDLANSLSLMDVDQLTRLMRKEKLTLNAESGGIVAKLTNAAVGIDSPAYALSEAGKQALMTFNRVWKPLQLARLGYTIRMLVDDQMRIAATFGAATYMQEVSQSLGHSLQYGMKDMAAAASARMSFGDRALTPRAKAAQTLEDLEAPRQYRAGVVETLERLARDDAALDEATEVVRRRLVEHQADNPGTRVYTSGTGKVGAGARLSPRRVPNGRAYVLAEVPEEQIHVVDWGHSPAPGRAYLEHVDDGGATSLLADLDEMTVDQIRAHIAGDYPDAKVGGKSKDKLIDLYGQLVASSAGIRVIEHGNGEFTALDRSLLKPVHPEEHRLVAQWADMREESLHNASLRDIHTDSLDSSRAWLAQMDTDWERAIKTAAKPSDGAEKFGGTLVLRANGIQVVAESSFAGAYGRMFKDLTSSEGSTRALTGSDERHLNNLRVVGGSTGTLTRYVDPTMTRVAAKLKTETYDRGWATAVNRQMGNDLMMRQILKGSTDDQILNWMHHSAEGVAYMKKAPSVPASDPVGWLKDARTHVDNYLPDQGLRDLALAGRAKVSDLMAYQRAIGRADDLPTVHAQSLGLVVSEGPTANLWSRVVDFTFDKIATAPTNVLSRQPFFNATYNREIQQRFAALGYKDADMVDDATMARLAGDSRVAALKELKRTFYDAADQTNLGHAMRFTMPFHGAWQDALQTWSRLWMEDPSRLAHMSQAWQGPSKMPDVYESPDGEKYIPTPLPGFLKKKLGLAENGMMPANALKSLLASGDYWFLPGMGAPVSVPVATLVRDRPDLETVLKPFIPYGAGDSWQDQVIPKFWKKGLSAYGEQDDEDYAKALLRNALDVEVDNRVKHLGMTEQEKENEAERRTHALFGVGMAAAALLPFPEKVNSPYQLYIDSYRKMQEQVRKDPTALGLDGSGKPRTAQDAFLEKYGEDYYALTLAATKSNIGGIAPTAGGYRQFNEYRSLVREMPEMGSLIVGDTNGGYSSAVAQWMLDEHIGGGDSRNLRDIRDPRTAYRDVQTDRGWAKFRQIDNATDAALAERGLNSLGSKKARDIKAVRDAAIAQVKRDYPAWDEEFGTFDRGKADRRVAFMERMVEDERIRARPGMGSLVKYLVLRRQVVSELASRPSKNLQAKQNKDLKTVWDALVGKMRMGDTAFADLHTRWLSSDDLDTGGGLPTLGTGGATAPGPSSPSGVAAGSGPLESGNINLHDRPKVANADGSISTVRSMSFEEDGVEVLIPTVSDDGRIMSNDEAIAAYRRTGRHLGKFRSAKEATVYAQQLHRDQEKEYAP